MPPKQPKPPPAPPTDSDLRAELAQLQRAYRELAARMDGHTTQPAAAQPQPQPTQSPPARRPAGTSGPCSAPGCDREARHVGYCLAHYRQMLRGKKPTGPVRETNRGLFQLPFSVRVLPHVFSDICDEAAKHDRSPFLQVREILERWSDAYRKANGIVDDDEPTPAPVAARR